MKEGQTLRNRLTGAVITVGPVHQFTGRAQVTDGIHTWSESISDLEKGWQVVPEPSAADLEAEGQGRLM